MDKSENYCNKTILNYFVLIGLILSIGLVITGFAVKSGLTHFRNYDRYVTVKGLATRDVEANLAVWSLASTATGNSLEAVQNKLDSDKTAITSFFQKYGFAENDIKLQNLQVTDTQANAYRNQPSDQDRFIISQSFTVRTESPKQMREASANVGELLKKGVVLGQGDSYSSQPPQYLYTKVNDIKPEMIAEATENARMSAQQFAKDSGAKVGMIRSANQGVMQIEARDPVQGMLEQVQFEKTIRIVSTIEFYLEK